MTPEEYQQIKKRGYSDEEIKAKGFEVPASPLKANPREEAVKKALGFAPGANQTMGNIVKDYGIPAVMPFGKVGTGAVKYGADLAMGGIYNAFQKAAEGAGIKDTTIAGLMGAGGTAAGKVIATPAKLAAKWAGARVAEGSYKAKKAFDKAFGNVLDTMYKEGHVKEVAEMKAAYEAALPNAVKDWTKSTEVAGAKWLKEVGEHGEKTAKSIMDLAKQGVPAWKGFGSDVKGLTDAVVGKGQQLLSQEFDKEMKNIIKQGVGKNAIMRGDLLDKLGVPGVEVSPGMFKVQASELAKASIGAWKKNPEAYRAAVEALDKIGLGSEAARTAYKTGQGVIGFVDKTGALKGDKVKGIAPGTLDSDKLVSGMYDVKTIDQLRKRGIGDAFRGPFQEARGGPLKPQAAPKPTKADIPKPNYPEAPKPVVPGETPEPDIRSLSPHPAISSAAGGAAGYGIGSAVGHPYIGATAGSGIGGALGGIAQGPVPQGAQPMLDVLGPLVGRGVTRGIEGMSTPEAPYDAP